MQTCPYCNAEIEQDATFCASCNRYLAVEIEPRPQDPEEESRSSHRGPRQFVYYSRRGCGCCSARVLAIVCIVLGFRWRGMWVAAALLLLLELIETLRRK